MTKTLAEYSRRNGRPELLAHWHPEKNEDLTPASVSYGSKKKIWWRCEKGHEWQAALYTRTTGGSGCPYCGGKRPWPGENDLASRLPELAAQWHTIKNGLLTPRDVTPGSSRPVWWHCRLGHTWQASVKSRAQGAGCPVCANRLVKTEVNDLASTHPILAAQWHRARNGALRPEDFVSGSKQKVWWRCEKGHEYQARIFSRACRGTGCPVCTGKMVAGGENDLESLFPALAAQWHPEKNTPLTPRDFTAYSNRRVWWRCGKGHEWEAAVSSRSSDGVGCPYCSGRKVLAGFNDLATIHPAIAAQWSPDLNGALTPEMVTAGSSKRVWWRCGEGHVWKAVISSRTGKRKHGCPVCSGRYKAIRYKEAM